MGTIVAFANQKGGVGKTTLAAHIGAWLSAQGERVIAVDGDPQANLSSWLLDGQVDDPGLFRLLVAGDPLHRVVRAVRGEWQLGLLPGNYRTGEAMIFLAATGRPFDTVARTLRPLASLADYVLLDMPPSRAAGFLELLYAADLVVVPTQLERLSLEGVTFMAQAAQDLASRSAAETPSAARGRHSHGPRLLGIVPNMARGATREHRQQMRLLFGAFGETVWPPVPLSIRVTEACAHGQTLFTFCPGEFVTGVMERVARRFRENVPLSACATRPAPGEVAP